MVLITIMFQFVILIILRHLGLPMVKLNLIQMMMVRQNKTGWSRYGVLRNNWYEISVSGLKGFGHATIPDLSNIPDDDNLKEYVSVRSTSFHGLSVHREQLSVSNIKR